MARVFSPELFAFLRELKAHNTREWFQANKARYVAVAEAPMLEFIRQVGDQLRLISPKFVADPRRTGGSMFRIYRDTRFSADKTPYKTWLAARFPHEAGGSNGHSVPGFYVRLSLDESGGGAGIFHPETAVLTRIRQRIVSRHADWAQVRAKVPDIQGDRLKRAPAGFDAAHPFVDDLRLKDLYVIRSFTERQVTAPNFLAKYIDACREGAPLVEFITRSLTLRW